MASHAIQFKNKNKSAGKVARACRWCYASDADKYRARKKVQMKEMKYFISGANV
jgi:hypothetical protein